MAVNRSRAWRVLALLAVAAGWIVHPAVALSGDAGGSSLVILAPNDGAAMSEGRVLVIGRMSGEGIARLRISVNGKPGPEAVVASGGFAAWVHLSRGKNVIRVSSGQASATATVVAAERGSYAYHEPVEKCAECHGTGAGGYALPPPSDALCYRCHARQETGKLLHGPMGIGDCVACHDPHGSPHKALTLFRHETLCLSCHDQQSSEAHIRRSRGKACTSCHDPHSSNKPFLQK